MPRNAEDALVNELNEIRRKVDEAIQKIVDARVNGGRDDAAMRELALLQNREVSMTKPMFANAA